MRRKDSLTFKQERPRPSQGKLPICQVPTENVVEIPHAKAHGEHDRTRREEIGDVRLFLRWDALCRVCVFQNVHDAYHGCDHKETKDKLMVHRIAVYHAIVASGQIKKWITNRAKTRRGEDHQSMTRAVQEKKMHPLAPCEQYIEQREQNKQ